MGFSITGNTLRQHSAERPYCAPELQIEISYGTVMDITKETTKKYSLPTAVAMIVGICIGSGIFFKTDNILYATGGSVLKGVLVFVLGAVSIVFGGLTFGELAKRTGSAGGLIGYAEEFISPRAACAAGWYQTFVYYPALLVVVARVIGIYACMLFGIPATLSAEMAIGFAFCCFSYIYNCIAPKLGALFQNLATIVKLIPLVLFAAAGFLFGDPEAMTVSHETAVSSVGWISAVAPIAFSYDGWIISTSISHEIKNESKNLPRALVIGPLVVLGVYAAYFVGVSLFLGPDAIISMGDAHVYSIAQSLFGRAGGKIILIFIIISVMGTVNGIILGFIRMPYSLAVRENMLPFSQAVSKLSKKSDIPLVSAAVAFGLTVIWSAVHYFVSSENLMPNSDISEVSVALSYGVYIPLYFKVYGLYKMGEIKNPFFGLVCPLLAGIGSCIVLFGALKNPDLIPVALMFTVPVLLSLIYFSSGNSSRTVREK